MSQDFTSSRWYCSLAELHHLGWLLRPYWSIVSVDGLGGLLSFIVGHILEQWNLTECDDDGGGIDGDEPARRRKTEDPAASWGRSESGFICRRALLYSFRRLLARAAIVLRRPIVASIVNERWSELRRNTQMRWTLDYVILPPTCDNGVCSFLCTFSR